VLVLGLGHGPKANFVGFVLGLALMALAVDALALP